MAQTLYCFETSPRSFILRDLVNYFKLDVEVETERTEEFENSFPIGKRPAFKGEKGFKLHEFWAIFQYLVTLLSKDQLKNFYGKNVKEVAQVNKWISFFNSDVPGSFFGPFLMIRGASPYNKKALDENLAKFDKYADVIDARLAEFTYLATERVTFADFFAASMLSIGFATILGKPWAKKYPNITRWFNTVTKHAFFAGREFQIAETPLTYSPPKKEKKEQAPKEPKAKAAKAAKPAAEVADAPAQEAPKPKHPLIALGNPKAPLDEWKRQYSNNETKDSTEWFWKNQYDPEEWSLYKVDFKYNDELTLCFMSNNLIGGFFNRLQASTKFLFGCMVVYGENNNNGITGAFLVRGQDYEPAFDVAPDWESYQFTKLDASKPEDKEFFNNMLSWDHPVEVNGVKREISDGKVFK